MEIGEVFYPAARSEWRGWLEANHRSASEIWVRRFKKDAGEPTISYDDLVEECLCFGWIDGIIKKFDDRSSAQRVSPRRRRSFLSELNRQRIWKLQHEKRMTPAGLEVIGNQVGRPDDEWLIPDWVESQLREDSEVWNRFQGFPYLYRRLKVGWVLEAGEGRREEMQKRLDYLIKNTRSGTMYGTVPWMDAEIPMNSP